MKVLDLFCGAGGASLGLWQAGFDTIVGIDNNRNCGKRYPFDFEHDDHFWLGLVIEEIGEVAQSVNKGKPTPVHELVQIVALIESWVENR